jgi:hypothetical protein
MLSKNRLYTRKEPDKTAKFFIIFSEGAKTEPNYFRYFNGIASQIRIELVEHLDGKNSPEGLYASACEILISTPEKPSLKYELSAEDEIWFLIDTDSWGDAPKSVREKIKEHHNWFIAQSNPCFEVWLYFHFYEMKPTFNHQDVSKNWKQFLHQAIGGFNNAKHPVYIETAILNAKNNFSSNGEIPDLATTELFLLAEKILPLVKWELDAALKK